MRVELLGAINYDKLASYMDKRVDGIVSDNNSILECINGLKEKNLCTPENIGLIDDVIYYLEDKSNGDIKETYIKGLIDIKESFFKSRDEVDKAIKTVGSKIVLAIIVFLLPTLVNWIFFTDNFITQRSNFLQTCTKNMNDPDFFSNYTGN